MAPTHNCVLPHALNLPATRKLTGKRVVLASASPRRKEILQTIVRKRQFLLTYIGLSLQSGRALLPR
jgi:hypothetical protein